MIQKRALNSSKHPSSFLVTNEYPLFWQISFIFFLLTALVEISWAEKLSVASVVRCYPQQPFQFMHFCLLHAQHHNINIKNQN